MDEKWKPLAGYSGSYEVSNLGRIRSVARAIIGGPGCRTLHQLKSRILRPKLQNRGYLQVVLSVDGIHKMMSVHRAVAEAFVSNPDGHPIVNHLDGCQTHNRPHNLEWCTQRSNVHHARAMGRIPQPRKAA